MAALQLEFPIASVAIPANTTKSVIQLKAATNQRAKILGFGLYTDGVTSNAVPLQVRIIKQTTAATGSAITAGLDESELTETVQTSALGTITVEGGGTVTPCRVISVPSFMGMYEAPQPAGQELIIPGGGYVSFEVNNPSGNPSVNVRGWVRVEE